MPCYGRIDGNVRNRAGPRVSRLDTYCQYDAVGLAELVRRGDAQATDLVDTAIEAIEAANPRVNAVIHRSFERARDAAKTIEISRPFAGVPFLLKDLLSGYAGERLGNGSRVYDGFVAPDNAPLVQRYLDAGLLILGKTNTPEFGLMPVTEPAANGPSRNPWDPDRTPGGSSGGAGAAVASGMVPAAHGGDGGGSIRIPASCCGLFGMKPSRGRNPWSLPYHVWLDGVVEHVLTRSVRDSAALLDATALHAHETSLPQPEAGFLAEVSAPGPRLRIGVIREPLLEATFADECVEGLERTARLCTDLGHEVVDAAPPIDRQRFATAFARMLCAEVAAELTNAAAILNRRVRRDEFEAITWALGLLGRSIPAVELVQAQRDINMIAGEFAAWTTNFDVVLAPTLAEPAIPLYSLQPRGFEAQLLELLGVLRAGPVLRGLGMVDKLAADAFRFIPTTPLFNMTGQPAMSVPLHWSATDLPVGMHFSAQIGEEGKLFRLAGELETAAPWQDRRPSM